MRSRVIYFYVSFGMVPGFESSSKLSSNTGTSSEMGNFNMLSINHALIKTVYLRKYVVA